MFLVVVRLLTINTRTPHILGDWKICALPVFVAASKAGGIPHE
jgi:hypothetical protein